MKEKESKSRFDSKQRQLLAKTSLVLPDPLCTGAYRLEIISAVLVAQHL